MRIEEELGQMGRRIREALENVERERRGDTKRRKR